MDLVFNKSLELLFLIILFLALTLVFKLQAVYSYPFYSLN